jgi:hypothetical protein
LFLKRPVGGDEKMLARAFAVVAALLAPTAAGAEDDAAATLRDLLAQYRCPVVDRFEQIYNAAPHSHPQNLFLIVYFAARPHDYVQCVFDPLTYMFREAASGFYDNVASEPRTRHLPATAIAALGRLGFSTDDSAGNFRIGFEVKEPPDFNTVADLILQALHDAFDARAGVTLLIEAPLAPRPTGRCVPVS